MRNQPVNWFFLALSVSDLAVMLTSFLVFQLPAYAERMDNLGEGKKEREREKRLSTIEQTPI